MGWGGGGQKLLVKIHEERHKFFPAVGSASTYIRT
jgi:hypothetical protein